MAGNMRKLEAFPPPAPVFAMDESAQGFVKNDPALQLIEQRSRNRHATLSQQINSAEYLVDNRSI
jgi:hypothetical protein